MPLDFGFCAFTMSLPFGSGGQKIHDEHCGEVDAGLFSAGDERLPSAPVYSRCVTKTWNDHNNKRRRANPTLSPSPWSCSLDNRSGPYLNSGSVTSRYQTSARIPFSYLCIYRWCCRTSSTRSMGIRKEWVRVYFSSSFVLSLLGPSSQAFPMFLV